MEPLTPRSWTWVSPTFLERLISKNSLNGTGSTTDFSATFTSPMAYSFHVSVIFMTENYLEVTYTTSLDLEEVIAWKQFRQKLLQWQQRDTPLLSYFEHYAYHYLGYSEGFFPRR